MAAAAMPNQTGSAAYLTGCLLMTAALGCSAVTSIDTAYVVLSPAGTDMMDDGDKGGDVILAARPVLIGPVPESLVAAVLLPFRLERVVGKTEEEANIARLSGIEADVDAYTENGSTVIRVDLARFDVPDHLGLSDRRVLEATLQAIRQTLTCARSAEEGRYRIEIVGAASMFIDTSRLSGSFEIGSATERASPRTCPVILD